MLAALIAAAIPVILHLLNLQKVEKIEFSSIMLLKEIRKSRFRKLRIKQFLLMLIRLLTIVFLVLAFADPYFKNVSGKSSDMKKTALIVIDSSYSMNAVSDSVRLKDEAEIVSEKISELFTSSDRVIKRHAYVMTGDTSVPIFKPDLNSIIKSLNEKPAGFFPDEVYVITDMQKINFEKPARIIPDEMSATRFYFLDISSSVPGNVSVNRVFIETGIPNPGGVIRIRAAVKNEGANYIPDVRITLFADNVQKTMKSIELKPGERKETEFEFTGDKTGTVSCRLAISGVAPGDNALTEDDSYNFSVFIPEKIKIGILKGGATDTKYIESVFDAANMNLKQGQKTYEYSVITSTSGISGYDVLFLAGFDSKSAADSDELKKFLESGKGIFVFPSESYGWELLQKIASVSAGKKAASGKVIGLSGIKYYEPLFEGMFRGNSGKGEIAQPVKTASYYDIKAGGNSYPVISMDNGSPLIILDKSNYGFSLVSSLPADETMSDFPKNEIFAPLILRSSVFLSYTSLNPGGGNFVVNHDTLESVTSKAETGFVKDVMNKCGIKNFDVIERKDLSGLEKLVEENRKGKSLWIYALIAVILLLASEIMAIKKIYSGKN